MALDILASFLLSARQVCPADQFEGAGKSTLIKLVIDLSTDDAGSFSTPIVGSVKNQDVPTSGDVHLYPDPNSISSVTPILYADCEGLEGGEREPISSRFKKNKHKFTGVGRVSSFEKKARRTQHTSEREITWADTPAKRSREFAVTHLYPRLLYTFSDVVVFVLKNPRYLLNIVT
jgi:energy-coupling factor transporter ATP-binding protein EcfA2